MPPVKHHHHQDVPHLVAGAQVVQLAWGERAGRASEPEGPGRFPEEGLTWEVALRDLGDVEEEGSAGDQVHDDDARQEELHRRADVNGEGGGGQADSSVPDLTCTTSELIPPLSQTQ